MQACLQPTLYTNSSKPGLDGGDASENVFTLMRHIYMFIDKQVGTYDVRLPEAGSWHHNVYLLGMTDRAILIQETQK